MTVLAGLFLIAHGLLHIAVWLAPQPPDVPFESRHSWLIGDAAARSRALAVTSCVLLTLAGILVLLEAEFGTSLAIAGAGISLVLILLTFNPWFVFAVVINIAIIVIALT